MAQPPTVINVLPGPSAAALRYRIRRGSGVSKGVFKGVFNCPRGCS